MAKKSRGIICEQLDIQIGHICVFNGVINRKNPLTLHHINPIRNGGKTTLDNLIYLARLQHDMFNLIESKDRHTAEYLTEYFYRFKQFPDMELRQEVSEYVNWIIFNQFHCSVIEGPKSYILKR